ncbi:MAG: hypothetical protein RLY37_270 [Verrucomicrobiota bacterium]|jgi:LL-diaminopimelate aminotransferase
MSDSYIQQLFAERIGGVNYGKSTAIYKFEKIKRAKAAAKKAKPDVALIDLGVGEPDEMAFPMVVKALQAEAAKPENRGYSDNGGTDFKQAAARYLQNLFGVTVDADTEVLHSIGSKAALSILPGCLINPGDYVLMTVPGYPVFGTHAKYYGGLVHNLKLTAENNFLPDLKSIPADILAKAFAKQHNLVVIQDAAYGSLHFGAEQVSILQVPGAKDVALELHSLSKSHNMTGWRIGFVAGNALLVRAYGDVKDNSDSGQFLGIQKAGAAGLDEVSIPKAIAAKYSRRMDKLVGVLAKLGFQVRKPGAGFFLYMPAPKSATGPSGTVSFDSGEAFSQWMITEHLISTVPWDDCGSFVRFSVTFVSDKGEAGEGEVIAEVERRLSAWKFSF